MNVEPAELVAMLSKVKSGTIQDGLDELGLFHQSLPPTYRMMSPPKQREGFVGPARTLLFYMLEEPKVGPFERSVKFWKFLEQYIKPGDVVVAGFEAEIPNCELVGGMLGTLYEQQGAAGWIGTYVRDLHELHALNMGFIGMGCHPAIARGRIMLRSSEAPVTHGGVQISTGDYIVADSDGAVVIPARDGTLEKMYAFVADYVPKEHAAKHDMDAGVLMSDVIDRHRIL
ncbi:MAG: RraA family protein [Deltaproteobacteria bacterium]|nr:RraA family protein [Deltaproteobacteria bacterium]